MIRKFDSAKAVMREIRRGTMVGILIDQNVDRHKGVLVDLFTKKAYTTDGIEYGRALLRGDHQIPPELFAKMVSLFGRQGTIEITMTMGDYTMTAMLLNAVDQHLPPDREPMLPVH